MMAIAHASFSIKRTFKHPPAKVFEAFAEQDKKHHWFVASDGPEWTTKRYGLDFTVGGREHGEWVGPDRIAHTNETTYLDIVDNERIVYAYTMAMDGVVHSASLATIQFLADDAGTQLTYCEQGAYFQGSDGIEGREKGWAWLLDHLEKALA
ncbi:MAG: SRPBCC family protein [Rhizobiales bacterium]|nr:SRPBCC family protein [Hyphomicrobiales bacterium]MBO6700117.1 SRPBCC family protein [Hyphomicrobiales bacterium]MBO6737718.1 SRPBCC family protein [Hyphomicrobiales bacterium]MBO6913225.1 SRPBCC family protein [Hyphomicrobiales bacterium]MBO6954269.1 SRPBCC family protein [Hyphomicrobiales bacterium]